MTRKELLEIFDKIDLSDLSHNFQIIESSKFDKDLSHTLQVDDIYLEMTFNVFGKFYDEIFRLLDLTVKEVIFWKNEDEVYILNDIELTILEKVLTEKLKDIL